MRKTVVSIMWVVISLMTWSGCVPSYPDREFAANLTGRWLYQNPATQAYEFLTFHESGACAYTDEIVPDGAAAINGNYSFSEGEISFEADYKGCRISRKLQVMMLSEVEIYSVDRATGEEMAYMKVMGDYEVGFAEAYVPEYSEISHSRVRYEVHDASMAKVSPEGQISGLGVGWTMLNVITVTGRVCYTLKVVPSLSNMNVYLGYSAATLCSLLEEDRVSWQNGELVYEHKDNTTNTFCFGTSPAVVETICVDYSSADIYSENQIVAGLTDTHDFSAEQSTESVKVYVAKAQKYGWTEHVKICPGERKVYFSRTFTGLFKHHIEALGSTRTEVFELYGSNPMLDDEEEGMMMFQLAGQSLLGLLFEDGMVMCTFAYFDEGTFAEGDVISYMTRDFAIYEHENEGTDEEQYVLVTPDMSMMVIYSPVDNSVFYVLGE